ncbi:MAG: DHA2 family efflux MFS transporter permease subunit [Acetobacteraceae bacterium]|nr:DHA2 family efflux MFS transporter permease subunit [Acetobacteraceae bacterium]
MSGTDSVPLIKVKHRFLLSLFAMMATLMQILDSTIANVALPYMQGSLSTTLDQVSWVLTSYVIASAIMTAPVGWMAQRFGRKQLFIGSMVGFTIASMACGAAQTLEQMVFFRVLQGVFGAALGPLSQATMLDIYPFEQRAQAMAAFGIGIMVGPIMGPTLGGYLTDALDWRFVFYVNLPFGIIATIGLMVFMPNTPAKAELKFDWTGFSALAIGIGAFQLMLDRGSTLDWFTSPEIIIEAVVAGTGFYIFIVHMFTAAKPFLPPGLFKDRNFVASTTLMFFTGTILMASSALMSSYLQNLSGFPVSTAGATMAPRGLGTMVAMIIVSRLAAFIDPRKIMAFGLTVMGFTLHAMSQWTPDISSSHMITTFVIQGFAMGCVFNPMNVMAYVTLPPNLRGDATAMQNLSRNIGAAIGIAVTSFTLVSSVQISHADLASMMTPFNRLFQANDSVQRMLDPATRHGAQMLDHLIAREALIIAYNNDYLLMTFMVIPCLLLLPIMKRPERRRAPVTVPAAARVAAAPAE